MRPSRYFEKVSCFNSNPRAPALSHFYPVPALSQQGRTGAEEKRKSGKNKRTGAERETQERETREQWRANQTKPNQTKHD